MSLGETIRKKRLAAGYTVEALAQVIGVSRQTLFRYENGQIATIPTKKLERLAEVFGTTPSHLLAGEASGELLPMPDIQRLPYFLYAESGSPVVTEAMHAEAFLRSGEEIPDFCYTVRGDRMIGARMTDGDTVFLVCEKEVRNGEIALVSVEGECDLYRVYRDEGEEKLILTAENPAFPPLVFLGEEIRACKILGRVIFFQSRVR